MSKQIEALKLALEALKQIDEAMPFPVAKFAQAAIREALADSALGRMAENERELGLDYMEPAQQQQEPVAYASDVEFDDETEIIPAEQKGKLGTAGLRIPLYIEPLASKPWVGLTDEEKAELDAEHGDDMLAHLDAIEAKLKEKNA